MSCESQAFYLDAGQEVIVLYSWDIKAATRFPIVATGPGAPSVTGMIVSGAKGHEVDLPELGHSENLMLEECYLELDKKSPKLLRRASGRKN